MATMTLNLSDAEMAHVERLCVEQDLSKTALMKTALRTYALIVTRMKAGETMSFSGDKERIIQFVGPGFWPDDSTN